MTKKHELMWQQMADLTMTKCRQHCHQLGSCCSGVYCEMAAEAMEKAGVTIPPMPFIVDGKCVIPPHFRPLCTVHQCKIQSQGFDSDDPVWTDKYFMLREKLASTIEI
jgi:hypothetical protein